MLSAWWSVWIPDESLKDLRTLETRDLLWRRPGERRIDDAARFNQVVVGVTGIVVVVVVEVVVVLVEAVGSVLINAPEVMSISVSEPVFAPGVALLSPERLATQRSSPETANADAE